MPQWRIPLSDLDFGPEESEACRRVLASGWLSMGPEVAAFEAEFAQANGVAHAFAVANGTAALHLALLAAGVGEGQEVIQPALTFVASANMTIACGARPAFADIIDLTEPTIDPEAVERLITSRTGAVIVMHYAGQMARMVELASLCKRHGIALIEDACHAVGVKYRHPDGYEPDGRMAGSIGDLGAFSFFSNKNMATGEGGMIVTGHRALAERIKLLRSHGMTSLTWDRYKGHASSYEVTGAGFNYRFDELRAGIGRAQLQKLTRNNERRRALLVEYRAHLPHGWVMPFADRLADSSGHLMVALAPDRAARQVAMERLHGAAIQTSMHYPCIADFQAFAAWRGSSLPRTREFASRALTLPLFPGLGPDRVRYICGLISAG